MKKTSLKISIVIPAYNEQDQIASCLEAISRLEDQPYEVVVVDNMSTDNTAKIAAQFPFVKVIKESKRGVVYARDCGFNAARGDIIGRIDVDTILTADWTAKLAEIFKDDSVQAVSGGLHFYDIGLSCLVDRADAYWRAWMAKRMTKTNNMFLFGSNMAIRRSAWQAVKGNVCHQKGIHEDIDLALHMSRAKLAVAFEPSLIASISARRVDSNLIDLARYCFISPLTYIKHNAKGHLYMYPLIILVLINYILLRLLFRAFDSQAQRLSLKLLLLRQSRTRPNPADF